jgi:hypothetical protein
MLAVLSLIRPLVGMGSIVSDKVLLPRQAKPGVLRRITSGQSSPGRGARRRPWGALAREGERGRAGITEFALTIEARRVA